MMVCYVLIFFFKQETAYEMRISDWSSDVCSSDLRPSIDASPFRSRSERKTTCPRTRPSRIRRSELDRRRCDCRPAPFQTQQRTEQHAEAGDHRPDPERKSTRMTSSP